MGGRGEELFVGLVCALLALLVLRRMGDALRSGEVPLYRTRLRRADVGEARYWGLILLNGFLFLLRYHPTFRTLPEASAFFQKIK